MNRMREGDEAKDEIGEVGSTSGVSMGGDGEPATKGEREGMTGEATWGTGAERG